MKLTLVVSMVMAGLGAAIWPTSAPWVHTLDARPEAIATGSALLVLASILRRNFADRVR